MAKVAIIPSHQQPVDRRFKETKMKIHVLGSGTCFPAMDGQPERAHPGFFVRWGDGDQHLLFDVSAGIAERLRRIGEKPNKIRNLAISHAHPDHCCLQGFLQTCLCHEMREPGFSWDNRNAFPRLAVLAPEHIIRHIPILNAFYFEGEGGKGLPFPIIVPHDMTPESKWKSIRLGDKSTRLGAASVSHDNNKADALAFRLDANGYVIAYSGDCGFDRDADTSDGLLHVADNADLFICEASARIGEEQSAHNYGHLNPRQAGEIARDAQVKHLVLTHYSGIDPDEAMVKDCRGSGFTGEITIAKDGDVYKI